MEFDYDTSKDEANYVKHGVSLADATDLEWDTLWAMQDCRWDYGECRMIGYALMGDRLYCVVFTDRGEIRRMISLRKANNREIKKYVQAVKTQ